MGIGVSVTYPDSSSGSDVVAYTCNRLGQQITITDQRSTVRNLYYDGLGRMTNDCVSSDGTGTDVAVKQIRIVYGTRGPITRYSSFDSGTPGSGTMLNDIVLQYNDFNQLTAEAQAHSGSVSGGTPKVQYGYDTGASGSNEIRLNQLTYPNARVITYSYGTSGGMNDLLNRVDTIHDTTNTTDLASYTYLGVGTVIRITYSQPSVRLDLWGPSETSGSFDGFDLFGRIVDQRWQNNITGTAVDIDRYKYGYDYNSNRQWKANSVATMAGKAFDEYYTYDAINRLTDMQRGTLNGTNTGISGMPALEQNWSLDPTGNWTQFATLANGDATMTQGRVSNKVNEITSITSSVPPPPPDGTPTPTAWVTPGYDDSGNMTTMPQVIDPTTSFTATYDGWNRMVSISDTGGTVATYQYDPRNRRIVKVTTSPSETRHFYYTNDWQDIEQRVGSSSDPDEQHVWGIRFVDESVCRDDATFTPARLYVCQDANFNVTTLVDTSGIVQQRIVYDPYGFPFVFNASWASTADTYSWTCRFTGRQYDLETELYSYRARYYHPKLGSFISRDPAPYKDGVNLFEYVTGRPTVGLDPFGKECETCENDNSGDDKEKAEKRQKALETLLKLLDNLKDFAKELAEKSTEAEKAVIRTKMAALKGKIKDLGTELGMEAVEDMVNGLDAFGGNEICRHWYSNTMKMLVDAKSGKTPECDAINSGNGIKECEAELDAAGAPGSSANLQTLADKARDACWACVKKNSQ